MYAQADPLEPNRVRTSLKRGFTEPASKADAPQKRVREIADTYVMYADDNLITPRPMPMRELRAWIKSKEFDETLNAKTHEARLRKIETVRGVMRAFNEKTDDNNVDLAVHLVDNLKRSDVAGGGLDTCVFRILLVKQSLFHQATGLAKLRAEIDGLDLPNTTHV